MRIKHRGSVRVVALGATLALTLAACGGDGDEGGTESPTGDMTDAGPVPGITDEPCENAPTGTNDKCVYLGQITDLTGVFAGAGTQIAAAIEDFWDTVNSEGGINGYDIDVRTYVEDTGYSVDAHADAYEKISGNVFALAQSLGTNHTVGVLDAIEEEDMISFAATLWSGWEFEPNVVQFGPNYCFEAMNAVDWEVENNDVESVMAVHFPGDYGGDGAAGTSLAAAANGITEIDAHQFNPDPTAEDQAAEQAVQAILTANPDLVVLAIGPAGAAKVIGGAVGAGYTGRFMGLVPVDSTPLIAKAVNTDLQPALANASFIMASGEFGSDTPGHQAAAAASAASGVESRVQNEFYTLGWAGAYALKALLDDVLAAGNPTRAAMVAAASDFTVDYQGMAPTKTFGGDPNENVQRSVDIGVFSNDAPLGLARTVTEYTGPTAAAHDFTAPCVEVS